MQGVWHGEVIDPEKALSAQFHGVLKHTVVAEEDRDSGPTASPYPEGTGGQVELGASRSVGTGSKKRMKLHFLNTMKVHLKDLPYYI